MWFEALMGFRETRGPDAVREQLELVGHRLRSRVNGREFGCGRLETPSLRDLRQRAAAALGWSPDARPDPPSRVREVVADVQKLHADPENAGALFQVASQFNLLEMVGPDVTPEAGVGIYGHDRTQGPACAIAAGAGTIYRNYFAPVGDQIGQSADCQIDCLADLGRALGNEGQRLWRMCNGYALLTEAGLAETTERLHAADEPTRDALREDLRVGIQWDVEVTWDDAGHGVTQVFGSALPVRYGFGPAAPWEALARLVLEASYEATLHAAALNAAESGCNRIYLTLLGGGAFGNAESWIIDAIAHALDRASPAGLDIAIVSHRRSKPALKALMR